MAAAQNVDRTLCLRFVTVGLLRTVIQSFSVLIYLKQTYQFYVKWIHGDDYRCGESVINSSKIY
jgi:hypothetical protein